VIDLPALRAELAARGSPLILAASDTTLPAELHGFLTGIPGAALTLHPASDGIRLDGDTLTVTGSSADAWPVQGFAGITVTLAAATIAITNSGGSSAVAGRATGALPAAGRPVAAELASATIEGYPAWTLTLAGPASGLRASDLVTLGLGQGGHQLLPAVPAELDAALNTAVTVAPAGFAVTFFPGTTARPWFTAGLHVPQARWTLIEGALSFDGIDVAMFLMPDRHAVTLTSHLTVGGFGVDVGVGMADSPHWIAFVRPSDGKTFPGLAALASWLCDPASGVHDRATGGFEASGFDLHAFDLAIASIRVGFDWQQGSLDFAEIVSVLQIKALRLDVAVRIPDLTIYGGLYGGDPLNVATLLESFGLDSAGVPAHLTISQASFTAQPVLGHYAVSLVLDDAWPVGPSGPPAPLTLEQAALMIARDPAQGFTGSVSGLIMIGSSVVLDVTAEYDGPSTGWTFSGGTAGATGLQVGDVIALLTSKFGITAVPEALRSLKLTNVLLEYQTGTGTFIFTCEGDFPVAQPPVKLAIEVTLKSPGENTQGGSPGAGYTVIFGGQLSVGDLGFDVYFDTDHGGEEFIATFHQPSDAAPVNVHDLVASLSPEAAAGVPTDLSIGLTDVKFVYAKPAFALGIDLSAHLGLAQLPVIGGQLPPDATLAVTDLQLMYSSAKIDAASIDVANGLLGQSGVIPFPVAGLTAGLAFTADLQVGTDHEPVSLGVPAAAPLPAVAASGSAAQPVGHWFDVHKSVGPVSIGRIGVQYQDGALFLLIDASLSLAALSVGMDGLGLGSPLTKFAPVPHLDGMSIAFSEGPVSISGGFLVVSAPPKDVSDEYAGELAIAIKAFMISGFGVYAKVSGHPSFFAFVEVDGEFGGPPAFFVTGLMGGVGYNWALALPPPDQVHQFPFVSGLGNPAVFGAKPKPLDVLGVLSGQGGQTAWVTPSLGTDWLAAGVQFRSFELIVGRALLVAEFGKGFELAILGLATVTLPQPTQQGAAGTPYAYAELQLEVVLKPDDGVFWAIASLTPNSFLLTKQCQLTGGFAFCVWFGANDHAGDFVLTLGGYHPAFTPKPWYPTVPPVGFHWAVDNSLVIKGAAYFAITPTAAMAGGSLEVVFESGDLSAWLTAHANIMIRWRPFYMTAEVGISIGVSYRLNLGFTSTVLAVELGASLNLWGPPTGGVVHVDWYIISFSISFGADPISEKNLTLDWAGFQALLPSADHQASTLALERSADQPPPPIVTLSVSRGLRSTDSGTGDWIVRADELVLTAVSAVPMTSVSVGRAVPLPAGAPAAIDIRPMGASAATSPFTITVSGVPNLATWPVSVQSSALPEALWGKPITDDAAPAAAAGLIDGLPTGVVFGPLPASAVAGIGPFDPGSLISPVGQGAVLPLRPASQADPIAAPVPDAGSIKAIADNVASGASRTAQAQLVSVLASYAATPPTSAPLTKLGDQAGAVFAQPPMRTVPA